MQTDQFDTEGTRIAGFILELHGTLVRKAELALEIREALERAEVEGDKTVDTWQSENLAPHEG
eukprot:10878973-Ditylum_brightwellii.AAC.1